MQKKFFDWVLSKADLPSEVLPNTTLVEILGDNRVLIENHEGVTKYCCNEICVKVSYGMLSVCGMHLKLACITKQQLIIVGCVNSISLIKGCR